MNIAICDDEQQDIDILYNYCKSCKLPYNISTFLSASALLEAFKSQFYDLIFLDIEMYKPNGFEICKMKNNVPVQTLKIYDIVYRNHFLS